MKPFNLSDKNINRLLCLVLYLLCLTAGVLAFWYDFLLPQLLAQKIATPSINITRAEYEQALSTWRAHRIEEYELTIYEWASVSSRQSMTFRVTDYGKEVYFAGPYWVSHGSRAGSEFMSYTIEAIFDEIGELFDRSPSLSHYPSGKGYLTTAYEVRFHPSLGYPTQVLYSPRHVSGTPEFVLALGKEVQDVKILKQNRSTVP